jgi:hypothetical protein
MNVIYSLAAYPFGKLLDSVSQEKLLASGLIVIIAADLVLAHGNHWTIVLLGVDVGGCTWG